MSIFINISVIALVASLCSVLLKRSNAELAMLVSVCGAVIIFASILSDIEFLTQWIGKISEMGMSEEILHVLLKSLGISIASKTAASLCYDCGESSMAIGIELSAKVAILLFSFPLIESLLALIEEVLKI